jgi:hypothetical protein
VSAIVTVGCRSPRDVIRPVIHTNDDRISAIKSAPIIVVAEIQHARLLSDKPRLVEKPPNIGGPETPRIPLYLAEISARVALTVRGSEMSDITFYTWVWNSGMHGGPRLFHPQPGSVHVMFLQRDSRYLRTVGDYPNYDVEIPSRLFPSFLKVWRTGYGPEPDLVDRIVAVLLKTYFESSSRQEVIYVRTRELAQLTGPSWFASQLNRLCHDVENSAGRAQACAEFAVEYGH